MNSLFVCYISGMDLRRCTPAITPYMADLMAQCPFSSYTNLPSNELFPTLVTGVNPVSHGVWGVQHVAKSSAGLVDGLVDALPDRLTTTVQCVRHYLDNSFDLAAIPPKRRREFKLTRTKYKRRTSQPEALYKIGDFETVMGAVGRDQSHYSFSSSANPTKDLLPGLCTHNSAIEILELYSLDRFQQWNLDRSDEVDCFYTSVDQFLNKLHDKCKDNDMLLMVLSDHGHEAITHSVDIIKMLKSLNLGEEDFSYFIEVSSARIWTHTDKARNSITEYLSSVDAGRLLHYKDMHQFGMPLTDSSYGEYFLYLDPGSIFFPHDFHQPLAQWFLGLTDKMQRSRLRDPRHKGNHGHLNYFEAERSFVLLADPAFELTSLKSDIIDIAPSMLSAIGRQVPVTMTGRRLFQPRMN